MNIFNPQLCLSKELLNSWATNIEGFTPNKVPIEVIEGVPRLKLIYKDSCSADWFAIALPLNSNWGPQSLHSCRAIYFTIAAREGSGGVVRLEDGGGIESLDFDFSSLLGENTEEVVIEIPLEDFGASLDITSVKLMKFIGYKDSAFYISRIYAA